MHYFSLFMLLLSASAANAGALQNNLVTQPTVVVVPSGIISPTPIISDATFARIAQKNGLSSKDFGEDDLKKLDAKFTKVVTTLQKGKIFEKIGVIAKKYNVKPEAVAACIIGEHVFNVGIADQFQSYFINIYSQWLDKHDAVQHLYIALLKEPEVTNILKTTDRSDYEKWDAIFDMYNSKYRGRNGYPDAGFIFSFFNPYGAGLTYGLGQLSPVRVLLTNDIAVKMGGLPRIDPVDTEALYLATLDIDTNIHYVAASVVAEIVNYKKYANMDISNNIGILSTLYNLGAEKRRAMQLGKSNGLLLKSGQNMEYPKENFYGWYMNKKEDDIKFLFK